MLATAFTFVDPGGDKIRFRIRGGEAVAIVSLGAEEFLVLTSLWILFYETHIYRQFDLSQLMCLVVAMS